MVDLAGKRRGTYIKNDGKKEVNCRKAIMNKKRARDLQMSSWPNDRRRETNLTCARTTGVQADGANLY